MVGRHTIGRGAGRLAIVTERHQESCRRFGFDRGTGQEAGAGVRFNETQSCSRRVCWGMLEPQAEMAGDLSRANGF